MVVLLVPIKTTQRGTGVPSKKTHPCVNSPGIVGRQLETQLESPVSNPGTETRVAKIKHNPRVPERSRIPKSVVIKEAPEVTKNSC